MARLKEKYDAEIRPNMVQKFSMSNIMQCPRLEKIVVNMGLGDAPGDPKIMDSALSELAKLTGQQPVICRAKRPIAGFKLRAGQAIGCRVTLRGKRMYEFLDRLLNAAIPRIRDFRGVSPDAFDSQGNYTLGLREQLIFAEIDYDDIYKTCGMNVVFVIRKSGSTEQSRELLRQFGMPFARTSQEAG